VIQGEGTPSNDDHSDRFQFATPIDIGAKVSGTLEKERDEDWFTFALADPMEISAQSATDVNVKAGLYTSRGRFIVSNDDDGGEGNFLITRILEAGQYHLKVRASDRQETGQYAFTVNAVPADLAPEIAVKGDNMEIVPGATETSPDDGTNFGEVLTDDRRRQYFVITNDGSVTLD
jgi:hypothetical protein